MFCSPQLATQTDCRASRESAAAAARGGRLPQVLARSALCYRHRRHGRVHTANLITLSPKMPLERHLKEVSEKSIWEKRLYSFFQQSFFPWQRERVCAFSPGKNTGVGCHSLLQGILLTQGLNLHLLHWQADSFPPSTWRTPCEVCSEVKTSVIVIQEKHLNSKALSRRSIKVEKVLLRLKCFQI